MDHVGEFTVNSHYMQHIRFNIPYLYRFPNFSSNISAISAFVGNHPVLVGKCVDILEGVIDVKSSKKLSLPAQFFLNYVVRLTKYT